jgi:hypothetical protein
MGSLASVVAIVAFFLFFVGVISWPIWRYVRRDKHRCANCGLSVIRDHKVCPYCGHLLGTPAVEPFDQERWQG